jgi:hypothetical protein
MDISMCNTFSRVCTRIRRVAKRELHRLTSPRMVSAYTLSEQAFLAKFELQGEPVAKDALLAHYGQRATPAWPPPPEWIGDPPVQMSELSREELVVLADSFLEGGLLIGEHAPQVGPDGMIAWHSNPTLDPEWLWALNRHQWWCIWGLAYAQTEDERYATAFVHQMLDWSESSAPPSQKDERSPSWRLMEVALRMRISWIPCFALFYHSAAFTDDAKMSMLRAIYDHARFLHLFRTSNNHLVRESSALVYLGTYFPEFREAGCWQQEGLDRLDKALSRQVNSDGSHFEVSTGYQSLVIDEYQNIYDLLQANHLSLPRADLAFWLRRMYRMMAYLARPDGAFPQINDGFAYWTYPQLARAGQAFECDDLTYVGTAGSHGTPPSETSVGFEDAGLYVMRSDWSRAARYLLFDSGPYGGYHGHEDKLSIELYAFGQAFLVDPGCPDYNQADPFRVHFVSSQAHNTVLVDGKSQIRRWNGENLSPKIGVKNHTIWISQPGFDYVSASYCDGYGTFHFQKPREADIIKDVIHSRQILFVKPDYWIVVDRLQARLPHTYQVLFHTLPGIVAEIGASNRVVLSARSQPATLVLIPVLVLRRVWPQGTGHDSYL